MDLTVAADRAALDKARDELGPGRIALVPTMGALHEGHRSLMRLAREHADHVVVSVFVNPLQFGPDEDFSRYPRTFEADLRVCEEEGVRVVFTPSADDMYLPDRQVEVSAGGMGGVVEGAFRPGHFDGVLTVVLKLFNLVRPDVAVFGQKDAQQLALIRRMVADLDVPVSIVGAPTVREPDGLALSSRNRYLSEADRRTALALSRALRAGAARGQTAGPAGILDAARAVLEEAARFDPPLLLDYLILADPATFAPAGDDHRGEAILAVAAKVGTTRLIDNVVLTL
ncbi:pantoate--beta-alanine ligase [Microbispora bryophytorum]|uniref:Pantothenate synthetase n=1 Tax=Microbispora bryophytorum TaxID=1460882 RepID=A0A8H9H5Q5_9ACTN|nr:pantoate--beta-alanine ligase [Microbispora bryophytorum]MBD3140808.1 pantoate--beta-alanine ligase [Microbispora bryophytorum]TQS00647.1 pantoate--beta-alanine ligase [Microbispora bryophytorum]GGO31241.1 pantothenate synthetase [Microbispora bryophytorum]